MSDKDVTRRNILKGITVSAATATVGAGSVVGKNIEKEEIDPNEENLQIINDDYVQEVLEKAGNPQIKTLTKTIRDLTNDNVESGEESPDELLEFDLETTTGNLIYREFKMSSGYKEAGLYYEYKQQDEIDVQLPQKLRTAPKESTLLILKDQDNDIVQRRILTEQENRKIIQFLNRNTDGQYPQKASATGVYCEKLGGVYFALTDEEEEFMIGIVDNNSSSNSRNNSGSNSGKNPIVTNIKNKDYEMMNIPSEVSIASDCGGILFHPCTECAATSGGCTAGCSGVCVGSAGLGCAACILSACPYAVNSCCICLTCIDDFDWDDNPSLRRTCPEDIIP